MTIISRRKPTRPSTTFEVEEVYRILHFKPSTEDELDSKEMFRAVWEGTEGLCRGKTNLPTSEAHLQISQIERSPRRTPEADEGLDQSGDRCKSLCLPLVV